MPTFAPPKADLAALLGVLLAIAAPASIAAPLGPAVGAAIAFCVTAYAAFCHAPWRARALALEATAALAAGLLLGDAPQPLAQWLAYAASILFICETLGFGARRLRKTAITDPLTGLLNREGLRVTAEQAIATSRRLGRPLTLVHIDLDDFKAVNDSLGHLEGDRLLRRCAEQWLGALRASDTLARLGGDEFLLVLPGSDRGAAERLVERLRSESTSAWSHGSAELRPEESFDDCLRRADAALYAAKDRHSARVAPPERALPPAGSWRRAGSHRCRG